MIGGEGTLTVRLSRMGSRCYVFCDAVPTKDVVDVRMWWKAEAVADGVGSERRLRDSLANSDYGRWKLPHVLVGSSQGVRFPSSLARCRLKSLLRCRCQDAADGKTDVGRRSSWRRSR